MMRLQFVVQSAVLCVFWALTAATLIACNKPTDESCRKAIGNMRLPAVLRWSLWGLGMLVGWIGAPLHAANVLAAQFLAGLSQTAFEGDMDAAVADEAPPDGITTALAYSAATRALGGSIAVKTLPVLVTAQAIDKAVSAAVLVLGIASLLLWALTSMPWLNRRPAALAD